MAGAAPGDLLEEGRGSAGGLQTAAATERCRVELVRRRDMSRLEGEATTATASAPLTPVPCCRVPQTSCLLPFSFAGPFSKSFQYTSAIARRPLRVQPLMASPKV